MTTSIAGINHIRSFEGLELVGYADTGGVPTIGYGSTGPHIYVGQVITEDQAVFLMADAVHQIENGLNTHVGPQPTQGQFEALVDFAYNMGLPRLLGIDADALYPIEQLERSGRAVRFLGPWPGCERGGDGTRRSRQETPRRGGSVPDGGMASDIAIEGVAAAATARKHDRG